MSRKKKEKEADYVNGLGCQYFISRFFFWGCGISHFINMAGWAGALQKELTGQGFAQSCWMAGSRMFRGKEGEVRRVFSLGSLALTSERAEENQTEWHL